MGSYTKASVGVTRVRDNEGNDTDITTWILAVLW